MGVFFEEYEDESIGFTPDDLSQMLLKMYPKDFILSDDAADFIIDDLETWEQKCSAYETIKTIELFEKSTVSSGQLFSMLKITTNKMVITLYMPKRTKKSFFCSTNRIIIKLYVRYERNTKLIITNILR